MNYIGRYEVDFCVSNQCLRLFETLRLDDAFSWCYDSPLYLEHRIGKVCIYTNSQVSENPVYLRNHLYCWDRYDGSCQCSGTYLLNCVYDVSMTSWCWIVQIWQFTENVSSDQTFTLKKFWTWSYKQEFQTIKLKLSVTHGIIWCWCNLNKNILICIFECNASLCCGEEQNVSALFTANSWIIITFTWLYWYN